MEEKRYMDAAAQMNLIHLGKSAGVVYWKPAGLKLYEKLKGFIRKHHEDADYQEVRSPSIVNCSVFEQSGHSDKYADNMFFVNSEDGYALRPMSCPNHIEIYASEGRSYRDLPLPLFEFGEVFRNEASGSLQVLFRQRQFCQDDSHVFVNPDVMIDSVSKYLQMSANVYKELGFEKVSYVISLRPEKRFGSDEDWDKAEQSLRDACSLNGIDFEEAPGEGAFYGPKIELKVQDKLGRFWQLGTLQLDYVLPKRFGLEFVSEDNVRKEPVLLHHAVLGSLERMVGILLEIHGINLPEFLHPYPNVLLPVSEKVADYAKVVKAKLPGVILDDSAESLPKRIALWKSKGAINIYVVGAKEAEQYEQNGKAVAMLNKEDKKGLVEL